MPSLTCPRVMIAGTLSGVGKSLLMTGLTVALRKKGISVSCCTSGHALHQALVYSRISRRYTRALDRKLLTPEQVLLGLYQAGLGADIVLVDGAGGLYDGVGAGTLSGSDAEFAAITKTPVLLMADVAQYSNSLSALVKGYVRFASDVGVLGLIGSRLPIPHDSDPFSPNPVLQYLNECMRAYNLPSFIGGLPVANLPAALPPREISQEENKTLLPMQFFLDVGSLVQNHVDLDGLATLAQRAPELPIDFVVPEPLTRRCRLAVADDTCFNVCFQDNLDLLRYFGADIVPFSPLADSDLPRKIGGLYIPGAYLRNYGEELSRNEAMKASIRAFADSGGVIYSEGAGSAYLCRTFQAERNGASYAGVGLIPGDAHATQHPRAFLEATTSDESILGAPGLTLQGLSTGEWSIRGLDIGPGSGMVYSLQVKLDGGSSSLEGYCPSAQSCSTVHFLHFGSNPQIAHTLVEAATVQEPLGE